MLSGKKEAMVKSCCAAINCCNRSKKGSTVSFYRFPVNSERRARWISAINRKNWKPSEHSWPGCAVITLLVEESVMMSFHLLIFLLYLVSLVLQLKES